MSNSENSTAAAAQGRPAFKRILLKASGEALMGAQNYGVDVAVARAIAEEIKAVRDLGVEVAVGGGVARAGDSRRRDSEGDEGGRRLHGRPGEGPDGDALRLHHLPRGARTA